MRRDRVWLLACAASLGCAGRPQSPARAAAPAPAPAAAKGPAGALPGALGPGAANAGAPEPYAASSEDDPEDGAEPDELEPAAPEPPVAPPPPHPLADWSERQIEDRLTTDPASLGSLTLGRPNAGALLNAVRMPNGTGWTLIDPGNAWGTQETIDYLVRAIGVVRARHPGSHDVFVGHISARHGGPLRPHISHQAGRDVDLSYFHTDDTARWYARAHAGNLDRARTWTFVRALITETDVDLILIDRSLQKLLREHALAVGEDPTWLANLFDGVPGTLRPLIFHARGHATHLHVRFYNPIAQETARRAHAALVKSGRLGAATEYVLHRAKKGETLGMLARKYRTSVPEIMRANGLRGTKIQAKKAYRVPKQQALRAPRAAPVLIPPRRLPPPEDVRRGSSPPSRSPAAPPGTSTGSPPPPRALSAPPRSPTSAGS